MKKPSYQNLIGIVALGFLLGAGCVVRERTTAPSAGVEVGGEVDVSSDPPAPIVESIPPSPNPGLVWVGGAWAWSGGGWHWQAGRYQRPPHPGAVWVAHRYENRNGRRVWIRGGWR